MIFTLPDPSLNKISIDAFQHFNLLHVFEIWPLPFRCVSINPAMMRYFCFDGFIWHQVLCSSFNSVFLSPIFLHFAFANLLFCVCVFVCVWFSFPSSCLNSCFSPFLSVPYFHSPIGRSVNYTQHCHAIKIQQLTEAPICGIPAADKSP